MDLIEHKLGYFYHESSVIDEGARIGKGSKIWHWTHISSNSKIGENCSFGQGVYVGNNVKVGNRVKVQNNVSIYESVILEDDVFCGPSMVFTNVLNPRSSIERKNEYKKTVVKKGASIGANATIICGNSIGQYSFVAAGAVVTKEVQNFSLVAGVPAEHLYWISSQGHEIKFKGSYGKCIGSGESYRLQNQKITKI